MGTAGLRRNGASHRLSAHWFLQQHAAGFSELALLNPLYNICSATNSKHTKFVSQELAGKHRRTFSNSRGDLLQYLLRSDVLHGGNSSVIIVNQNKKLNENELPLQWAVLEISANTEPRQILCTVNRRRGAHSLTHLLTHSLTHSTRLQQCLLDVSWTL